MTYRDHLPEGFTGRAMIRGDLLPAKLQADALRAYLHRFTRDHAPLWSNKPRDIGGPYPLQFASDAEWLALRPNLCKHRRAISSPRRCRAK